MSHQSRNLRSSQAQKTDHKCRPSLLMSSYSKQTASRTSYEVGIVGTDRGKRRTICLNHGQKNTTNGATKQEKHVSVEYAKQYNSYNQCYKQHPPARPVFLLVCQLVKAVPQAWLRCSVRNPRPRPSKSQVAWIFPGTKPWARPSPSGLVVH